MNALTIGAAGAKTMTSREIAELTGKELSNIHRDIRTMLEQLGDDSELNHVCEDKDGRGYTTCIHLPKSLTMTLVAGYNAKLRKAIIDRWQQLEQQAAQGFALPDFTDPAAAAMAWADQYRAKQALQLEAQAQALLLAEVEPKAKALDRLATPTDGAVCLRIAAKLAQVPEKQFFTFLNSVSWIFRHHHSQTWAGYSDKERAGLLELKKTRVQRDDGSEKVVEQVLITPKGLAKIVELIERKAPGLRKTPNTQPTSLGAA